MYYISQVFIIDKQYCTLTQEILEEESRLKKELCYQRKLCSSVIDAENESGLAKDCRNAHHKCKQTMGSQMKRLHGAVLFFSISIFNLAY